MAYYYVYVDLGNEGIEQVGFSWVADAIKYRTEQRAKGYTAWSETNYQAFLGTPYTSRC